jgi:hypothetical protein
MQPIHFVPFTFVTTVRGFGSGGKNEIAGLFDFFFIQFNDLVHRECMTKGTTMGDVRI